MRVVAYLRVSTDRQANGNGLDAQEDACRAWADEGGHEVIAVLREAVSGAADLADRREFRRVLDTLEEGGAEGVVVANFPRLAREFHLQEAALHEVWRRDARLFTADEGEVERDDRSDPTRTLVRQVLGAISQFERSMGVKRRADGRRAKARRTERYRWSVPPYGYREDPADPARLVPDPATHPTVRRIIEDYQAGASLTAVARSLGEGWNPVKVARVLDREGVPRRGRGRPRRIL